MVELAAQRWWNSLRNDGVAALRSDGGARCATMALQRCVAMVELAA
jgi:hypothetical protein